MFQSYIESNTQPTSAAWYDEEASAPIYHTEQNNLNAVVVVAEPYKKGAGSNPFYR